MISTAVELLELHDRVDVLEEELRVRETVLLYTPIVSAVMAFPLLIVLFLHEVAYFAVYPTTFVVVLGAILFRVSVERGRLLAERESIQEQILRTEGAA